MSYRTQWCGEVIETMAGSRVQLAGWVHRRRDLGNLVFIDLRDRTGLLQLVFDPTRQVAAHAASHAASHDDAHRLAAAAPGARLRGRWCSPGTSVVGKSPGRRPAS